MTTTRPALGPLAVGDPVYVRRSPNAMRGRPESDRYIPAVVTSAARVWIGLKADESSGYRHVTWRMRRDTQDEATQNSGNNAGFVTPAQKDYDEQERDAHRYLLEQGLVLSFHSPWARRQVELAAAIRAIDNA